MNDAGSLKVSYAPVPARSGLWGKLPRYVLRQVTGPLLLFTLLITMVILADAILCAVLDLVINRGQSAGMFVYLTFLMPPSLLVVIVPIAFFAGAIYALNRLNSDLGTHCDVGAWFQAGRRSQPAASRGGEWRWG